MGFVRLFESERNEAMAPRVSPPMPLMARSPPSMAIHIYSRFPRFIIMGIRMLANLFAWYALFLSSSFFSSKPSLASCSWQNTFITFWPFIISSMYPLSSPRDCCCLMKNLAEFPAISFDTLSISTRNTATKSESHRLSLSMAMAVVITVMDDDMTIVSDWENI